MRQCILRWEKVQDSGLELYVDLWSGTWVTHDNLIDYSSMTIY